MRLTSGDITSKALADTFNRQYKRNKLKINSTFYNVHEKSITISELQNPIEFYGFYEKQEFKLAVWIFATQNLADENNELKIEA